MLKRLGEFACALLFGIEQPNVPNRNHSNGLAVQQQRHRHDASIGYHLSEIQGTVGGFRLYVRDLGDSAMQYCTAESRILARWPRKCPPKGFQPFSAQTMTAGKVQEIAVEPRHEGELATAQPHRALGNRVEHGLDVGRRARDDTQDIAGRRLVLERFGEFARACCSASNSRTLSIAITA